MNKIIGIMAKTKERGIQFLDDLIGEMKFKDVKNYVRNINKCEVELSNGTTYKVVPGNVSSRGYKFTDLYLDKDLDQEFINCIALPSLITWGDNEPTITYF
jgi:hypothetical protein